PRAGPRSDGGKDLRTTLGFDVTGASAGDAAARTRPGREGKKLRPTEDLFVPWKRVAHVRGTRQAARPERAGVESDGSPAASTLPFTAPGGNRPNGSHAGGGRGRTSPFARGIE